VDAFFSIIAFLFIVALAFFGLIRSPTVMRFVAHLAVTPQAIEKLRRAISDDCSDYDMGDMAPADAEHELAERTRHTIGRTLAEINPKTPIEVTKTWPPEPKVIITGDIAVIAPSLGILIMGPNSRIEPLKVRVKRRGIVTLDNKPPLKSVHDAIYEPPAKQAVNARPAPATASKPPPKPSPAKPTPVRR
jgi:hypothetical protein